MQVATRIFEVVRVGGLDGAVVVTPKRDLSEFDFEQIQHEVRGMAEDRCARRIIVDLGRTDYLGSAALGMFLWLAKELRQRGGQLAFCNVSAHEKEIFQVAGLEGRWPIFPSLEEGLRGLAV